MLKMGILKLQAKEVLALQLPKPDVLQMERQGPTRHLQTNQNHKLVDEPKMERQLPIDHQAHLHLIGHHHLAHLIDQHLPAHLIGRPHPDRPHPDHLVHLDRQGQVAEAEVEEDNSIDIQYFQKKRLFKMNSLFFVQFFTSLNRGAYQKHSYL